jgi:hypothetical protein
MSEVLRTDGIVIFRLPFDTSPLLAEFKAYMRSIPEFDTTWLRNRHWRKKGSEKDSVVNARVCAGGFGAFNWASAYHVPLARDIDGKMFDACVPILRALAIRYNTPHLEVMPDRLCFRPMDDHIGGESVHRDLSSGLEASDLCFGSFMNLNAVGDQFLTIEKGTHLLHSDPAGGSFMPIRNPAQRLAFRAGRETVTIPPGHGCLFFENILHEVKSGRVKSDSYRKFVGFRLTKSTTPWHPANINLREDQGALAHKGGSIAPMYPKLYRVNHQEKLRLFTKRFDRRHAALWHTSGRLENVPPSLGAIRRKYPGYTLPQQALYTPRDICNPGANL